MTPAEGAAMVQAFAAAEKAAPLRQVRVEMAFRRREWEDALMLLDSAGEDAYLIELVGAVTSYMRVVVPHPHGGLTDAHVVRVLHRDGGASIHYEDPTTGQPRYLNRHSAASPVVVAR